MTMLAENLGLVSGHWIAWLAVGLVALMGVYGIWHAHNCPYVQGKADVDPTDAAVRLDRPFVAGPGYAAVLMAGIAMMMAGLYLMGTANAPLSAFLVLVIGIVTVQLAPVFLRLTEGYDRVIAASAEGEDASSFARERLYDLHIGGVAMAFGISALLALVLLAF
ncbi:MAG: hypothetical protein AAF677_05180 [Pseudomonadota bacterium]